jgi:methylated-DNA-[protein]-cysteine S-methyltransferase
MNDAVYAPVTTPVGEVFAAVTDEGVRYVHPSASGERFEAAYEERFGFRPVRVERLGEQIERAIADGDPDGVEIDWRGVSLFTQAVLQKTGEIPAGEYRTYLDVAKAIGRPGASRAVGRALGSNTVPFLIPCHRVIASDGSLGGYGLGLPLKQELLEAEGADLPKGAATA